MVAQDSLALLISGPDQDTLIRRGRVVGDNMTEQDRFRVGHCPILE